MQYPVNFINITQGYHQGKCLDFGWSKEHGGPNVKILATANGLVKSIEKQKKGGNVIYLEHEDGKVSCYAHLSKILVKENEEVKMGQEIGKMGDSGEVTGPHLHYGLYENFDVRYKDSTLDPFKYLEVYPGQEIKKETEETYGNKIIIHEDFGYELGLYEIVYDDMYIRVAPNDISARKKVKDVTKDAQNKCVDKNPNANAILKKGSKFDCLEIAKNGDQIWGRTYSGWICLKGKYEYCKIVK